MDHPHPHSFTRSVGAMLARQCVVLACGICTTCLLARLLGPEGRGEYAVASLFAALLTYFSTLGTGQAATFYLAKGSDSEPDVLANSLFFFFVLSLMASAAGLMVVSLGSARLFPGVPHGLLLIAVLSVPAQLLFGFLAPILLGKQQIATYYGTQVLRAAALLIGAGVLTGGWSLGAAGALLAELVSFLAGAAVLLYRYRGLLAGWMRRIRAEYVRRAVRYGLASYAGSVTVFLHQRMDMLLMNLYLNPATVGIYAISAGLAEKVGIAAEGAATILFPRTSAQSGSGTEDHFTALVLRTTLLVVIGAAAVLKCISSWLIVTLYSPSFSAAAAPFGILLWGAVARCGWVLLESDLKGRGKPREASMITFSGLVVNVTCNLLWLPTHGVMGAAWAAAVSQVWCLCLHVKFHGRLSGQTIAGILLPRHSDLLIWRRVASEYLIPAAGTVFRFLPPQQPISPSKGCAR